MRIFFRKYVSLDSVYCDACLHDGEQAIYLKSNLFYEILVSIFSKFLGRGFFGGLNNSSYFLNPSVPVWCMRLNEIFKLKKKTFSSTYFFNSVIRRWIFQEWISWIENRNWCLENLRKVIVTYWLNNMKYLSITYYLLSLWIFHHWQSKRFDWEKI